MRNTSADTKPARVLALIGVLLLAGCSDVKLTPSELSPVSTLQVVVLENEAVARSTGGYLRTLSSGSQWVSMGSIREGAVMKPVDTVLTVEGIHVREAYIVVRDDRWVGFWLPNEEAFSPVADPVPVKLNPNRE
ncbi:MAG TPA: hypothetical protein VMY41_13890 [Thermohalobaculum sp.]|nr:hypothetical protein [Thermohalobaculum sp.]